MEKMRGKIEEICPVETFARRDGGQGSRRALVITCRRYDQMSGEVRGEYPVRIDFFGDRAAPLQALRPGMVVDVTYDITGRRSAKDGKVYNTLTGWAVVQVWTQQQTAAAQKPPHQYTDPGERYGGW